MLPLMWITLTDNPLCRHMTNMKNYSRIGYFLSLGVVVLLLLSSCRRSARVGFAEADAKKLPTCDQIIIDYPLDVTIHLGQPTAVVFDDKMPKKVLEELEFKTKGTTLLIASKRELGENWTDGRHREDRAHIDVYLPELKELEATSAAQVRLSDSLRQPHFAINLSGASQLTGLRLSTDDLRLFTSGASSLEGSIQVTKGMEVVGAGASSCHLSGMVGALRLILSGASEFDASGLRVRQAEARTSGASSVDLGAIDTLGYQLSGASSLLYRGKPVITEQSSTGASSVKQQAN